MHNGATDDSHPDGGGNRGYTRDGGGNRGHARGGGGWRAGDAFADNPRPDATAYRRRRTCPQHPPPSCGRRRRRGWRRPRPAWTASAGYCIIDLTSGERFERAAGQLFPTASTIKLAILYELMARADEGALSLDDTIKLDRARAVPGGILYELGTPVLSLRDYANVMVIESDNTATNVLIARLGMEAITARMAKAGLGATQLRRYMIDLEAAKRGNENVSTPAELARLLEMFHKGTGLTPARQEEALRILKKPKSSPIRSGVPAGIADRQQDRAPSKASAPTRPSSMRRTARSCSWR